MKLILSTHNIRLTKAIEDHVVKQLEKLDHFDRAPLMRGDTRTRSYPRRRKTIILFHSPECAWARSFAEHAESDLYAAIDKVTKKSSSKSANATTSGRPQTQDCRAQQADRQEAEAE